MKYFFSFLTALFFLGCMGSKSVEVPKKEALPQWYTTPPSSDATTLYALGEGKDKQEAIANALNYMASTLSVSISSSYRAQTKVKEGSVNSSEGEYNSDISSDVQKIRISNYTLQQEKSLGFKRYAVLIRSDKQQIFNSLKQELEQNITLFESKEKNLDKQNSLESYIFYKTMKKEFANTKNTLVIMGVLNGGFDQTRYLKTIGHIDERFAYYRSEISFSVNSNIKGLSEPVAKALSEKEYRISKKRSAYTIVIKAQVTKANAYGFTLARAQLQLTTKDPKGSVVGSNMIQLTGQSSQGYEVALQDLARQLNDAIKKEGIAKIINLDI